MLCPVRSLVSSRVPPELVLSDRLFVSIPFPLNSAFIRIRRRSSGSCIFMLFLAAVVLRTTLTFLTLPDRPNEVRYRDDNQEVVFTRRDDLDENKIHSCYHYVWREWGTLSNNTGNHSAERYSIGTFCFPRYGMHIKALLVCQMSKRAQESQLG